MNIRKRRGVILVMAFLASLRMVQGGFTNCPNGAQFTAKCTTVFTPSTGLVPFGNLNYTYATTATARYWGGDGAGLRYTYTCKHNGTVISTQSRYIYANSDKDHSFPDTSHYVQKYIPSGGGAVLVKSEFLLSSTDCGKPKDDNPHIYYSQAPVEE